MMICLFLIHLFFKAIQNASLPVPEPSVNSKTGVKIGRRNCNANSQMRGRDDSF